jgi:[acyl-carrier-protein] S-malonyltransferase
MSKTIALFPGQGSQTVGMGLELFQTSSKAKELFIQADEALAFETTDFSTIGLPVAAAGHSLGEYTALVAAGSLSFVDAVKLVHKRGKYMQAAVQPGEGKMIAVLGLTEEEILSYIAKGTGICEIANLNTPGQTVLSGSVDGVTSVMQHLSADGKKVIELNVSAPFHCSLMKPAAEKLAVDLDATEFKDPTFPVYANFTAKKIQSGSEARSLLKSQVCGSVRWFESIENMIADTGATAFKEYGNGAVLTGMMKRINKTLTNV